MYKTYKLAQLYAIEQMYLQSPSDIKISDRVKTDKFMYEYIVCTFVQSNTSLSDEIMSFI